MKIAIYSAHKFEILYLKDANTSAHELKFISEKSDQKSASHAEGCDVVALFSSDKATKETMALFSNYAIKLITTRSAGFNHIDLDAAQKYNITITNVPEYSPHAIAEHCVALMLALSRKLIPSYERIRNYDFSLNGLIGSELNKKTISVMGTGTIGGCLIHILQGFGGKVLAHDTNKNDKVAKLDNVYYVELDELFSESDIISLNLPLNDETKNIIDAKAIKKMKNAVILINAGRGRLVDTQAVIEGIKSEKINGFGMDVYEHEDRFVYEDHSNQVFKDDVYARLLTFKNVIVTAHQAFLTETVLEEISKTTLKNIDAFANGKVLENKINSYK